MSRRILSLGAVAMDIVINSHELPKDDGFALISHEELVPGGSAANVSAACAHLGMKAFQTGQIGDDNHGVLFRKSLREEGVDDTYLITKENGTTLHTYIITAPGGRHCIFANPGDSVFALQPEQLPSDIMDETDIFYCDMFSPKAALHLAAQAAHKGRPVVYNMQCVPSFMKICGTGINDIEKMMTLCTLFISGRDGYLEMTGEKDPIKAMKAVQDKYSVRDGVILTAGKNGAFWYDGQRQYNAPAYKVNVVDTTGAGDCFTGALMYAYYDKGSDRQKALQFAGAAAALKCTVSGPRSRANEKDVLDLMGKAL